MCHQYFMMKSYKTLEPVKVVLLFLLAIDISSTLTTSSICLTWNTTDSYLTIECTVHDARYTKDTLLIDPSGNIRVQCTSGESSNCSGSQTHLLKNYVFENITTLTFKTEKDNGEGKWKCRHGSEEAKSYVSYTEGSVSMIDTEISGEVWKTKEHFVFQLACSSCRGPYTDGADFYVNDKLEDSIRYEDGLCYHKRNLCNPDKCTCSLKGKWFVWIFISNSSYIQFTCSMRFKDQKHSTISVQQAHLTYNGSVFIQKQMTNTSIDYADKTPEDTHEDKEKTDKSDHIGYMVLGIVCLVVITIFLVCFWKLYNRRKKRRANIDREMDKSEEMPLQASQTNDDTEKNQSESMQLQHLQDDRERNNQNELTPLQRTRGIYNKPLSSRQYRSKDIKITCLFCHYNQEMEYANTLKINLQKLGFQSNNITLIRDDSLDEDFSEALKMTYKLIIVVPVEFELDDHFSLIVEKAVKLFKENSSSDILPIVRSKKATPPHCLSDMRLYSGLEHELKDALMQCNENEKIDACVPSFRNIFNNVLVEKSLDQMLISKDAREHLENFGFEVLKGWGVDVESDRVSFHIKTLQNLSHYHHICIHDVAACLFRGKSFRYLRLYDVGFFDLRDLKLHSNMYNELIQIFKLMIDMKVEKWWYHYRRNGFRHKGSSEGAFKLVKNVFLDKEPSEIFHQFCTYESRLATFQKYPIKKEEFRISLAKAGFFYYNVSDYVQCYHCGGCLRAWASMHDPMVRHKRNFKTCPVVLEAEVIQCSELKTKDEMGDTLHTPDDRLRSFDLFPVKFSDEESQRLSKAGFYYCGIAEDIVCCECNIGFAGVSNVDNILRLHETYSQDCRNIDNLSKIQDADDQECISNFVQYLELECIEHDFEIFQVKKH